MKILFIILVCIFVASSFYRYKFTSADKFIDYIEKKAARMRTLKRDLDDLSPRTSKVTYWSSYILSLLVKLSVVYLSCLGISTL